jgi:hypothetical protein
VAQVGYWLPIEANPTQVQDQEYTNKELNTLMENYQKNIEQKDILYQQMKEERLEEARKEVARKKREHAEKLKSEAEREPEQMSSTTGQIGKLRDLLNTVDENVIETEQRKFDENKRRLEEAQPAQITEVTSGGGGGSKEDAPASGEAASSEAASSEAASSEAASGEAVSGEAAESALAQEVGPSLEQQIENEYTEAQQQTEQSLNNFAVDSMTNLNQMDPWMKRQMEKETEMEKEQSEQK